MKRVCFLFHKVITMTLIAILWGGCERRPLEEQEWKTVLLPVEIDWTHAELDPDNDPNKDVYSASVWLFAKDGATPFGNKSYKEFLIHPQGGEIEIPVGNYSVLVFNNAISDYSHKVGFRGTDAYDTFEYYINPDLRQGKLDSDQEIMSEPDLLAVWNLDNLSVTPDMVSYTRLGKQPRSQEMQDAMKQLCRVRPVLFTPRIHVLMSVKGLKNAKAAVGELHGMGSAVYLATGKRSKQSVFSFNLGNPRYDTDNSANGTIDSDFRSIGPLHKTDSRPYEVFIRFTLAAEYNGSLYYPAEGEKPFLFDVSNQISFDSFVLQLNIKVGVGVGGDTPDVELPKVNGGFGVGVGSWGENIDIPMN